jgi:subtilisin family serine protease
MPRRFAILLLCILLPLVAGGTPHVAAEPFGAPGPTAADPTATSPSQTLRRIDAADAHPHGQAGGEAGPVRIDPDAPDMTTSALGLPDRPLDAEVLRKLGPGLQQAYRRLERRARLANGPLGLGGDEMSAGIDAPPGRAPWMDLGGWSPRGPARPRTGLADQPSAPLRVLVTAENDAALRGAGMRIRARVGPIAVGWIPTGQLDDLARLATVRRIELPVSYSALNDAGRVDIRAPQAVALGGSRGEGALIGVLDSGIDFTHPAFRAADGSTRIAGILDMAYPGDLDADGVLDGPNEGGTAYTRAEIDRALAEGNGSAWRWEGVPEPIWRDFVAAEIWVRDRTPVESLHVHLDIEHPGLAELGITIEDPDGNLYEPDALASAVEPHVYATYVVPVDEGVSAAGRWHLYVDNPTLDLGWLKSWALFVNRGVHQQDLNGHGTHVAGTAAGSGRVAGDDGPLVGVAPGAELLVVRGERAADGFDTDDQIAGLAWIDRQAAALGRPYVTNLSLGGHYGTAHDGSDPLEVAIDSLVGPGRPGKAVVVSAGNEGDEFLHAGGTLGPGNPGIPFWIEAGEEEEGVATTWAEIWVEASGRTTPGLVYPNSDSFSCYSGYIQDGQLLEAREDCAAITRLVPGEEIDVALFDEDGVVNVGWLAWDEGPTADLLSVEWYDSESWWVLTGAWALRLPGLNGRWDSWSSAGPACRPLASCDNESTVSSPGTARHALTVGAHVTRTAWQDEQGRGQDLEEHMHDLASFSSRGPTRDGRMKPDLSAPGAAILSARSSAIVPCPYGSLLYCSEPDEAVADWVDPLTAQSQGTSMAAPMASGAVGLLLSLDPTLDASEIAERLRDGARQDAFTGQPPRAEDWGAGKLDLSNVIEPIDLPTPPAPPPSTPTPDFGPRLVVETAGLRFTALEDVVFDGPATGRGTGREPIVLPERITGPRPVIWVQGLEGIENRAGYAPELDEDEPWRLPSVWLRMDVANASGESCIHYDHELQIELGLPSADDDGVSFGQGDPWLRPYRSDRFTTAIEETEARDFVNFTEGLLPVGERALFELVASMSWFGEAPGYDGIFIVQTCNRAVSTPDAPSPPPPTPVPPSVRKYTAYLPIALSGQQCPPTNVFTDIALIVDASTTMLERDPSGRTKHELSVDAARAFVDGLRLRDRGPSDQVALVAFNATSTVLAPLTPRRAELQSALDTFTPIQMQSRVELGIYTGLAQMVSARHRRANRQVMVVISDGKANPVPGEEAVQAARGAHEAGIDILVLGIGPNMDEDVLRRMASRPSDFYRVSSAAALTGILQQLASRTIPCDDRMYWPYR